jgi:phosphomannomutase
MAAKFGTSGLRGLATELLGGPATAHVIAFAEQLIASKRIHSGDAVYIGRDHRASSPELTSETANALRQAGLKPVDCGFLPTPALALHAMSRNAAAIMVTGSHIPADRNGIKFYRPDGEIDKADEAAMVERAAKLVASAAALSKLEASVPMSSDHDVAMAAYRARYVGLAAPDALKGWRIGVWQHSSVARDFLPELLSAFSAEIVAIERLDDFMPVDTEAVDSAALTRLKLAAKANTLDAIISTDADADRPLLLDANGRQVRGDVLGIITSRLLRADAIACPVTSNSGVNKLAPAAISLTKVGSPFVIAAMDEALAAGKKRVVGFEPNGGFLCGTTMDIGGTPLPALMTRDSTLPLLAMLLEGKRSGSVHTLVDDMGLPVAISDRIQDVPTEQSKAFVEHLTTNAAARDSLLSGFGKTVAVNTMDGLRLTLDSGVTVQFRPSGNAPEMRFYVEAADDARAVHILEDGMKRVKRALDHVGF